LNASTRLNHREGKKPRQLSRSTGRDKIFFLERTSYRHASLHTQSQNTANTREETGLFPCCGLHLRARVTREYCEFCKRYLVPAEHNTTLQSSIS
jgi:hypothetical protein